MLMDVKQVKVYILKENDDRSNCWKISMCKKKSFILSNISDYDELFDGRRFLFK